MHGYKWPIHCTRTHTECVAYGADVDPHGYPYYVNSAGKYLYRSQATNRWMLNGVHGAHFEACMTEIYLHIAARMADYMATHP